MTHTGLGENRVRGIHFAAAEQGAQNGSSAESWASFLMATPRLRQCDPRAEVNPAASQFPYEGRGGSSLAGPFLRDCSRA